MKRRKREERKEERGGGYAVVGAATAGAGLAAHRSGSTGQEGGVRVKGEEIERVSERLIERDRLKREGDEESREREVDSWPGWHAGLLAGLSLGTERDS